MTLRVSFLIEFHSKNWIKVIEKKLDSDTFVANVRWNHFFLVNLTSDSNIQCHQTFVQVNEIFGFQGNQLLIHVEIQSVQSIRKLDKLRLMLNIDIRTYLLDRKYVDFIG